MLLTRYARGLWISQPYLRSRFAWQSEHKLVQACWLVCQSLSCTFSSAWAPPLPQLWEAYLRAEMILVQAIIHLVNMLKAQLFVLQHGSGKDSMSMQASLQHVDVLQNVSSTELLHTVHIFLTCISQLANRVPMVRSVGASLLSIGILAASLLVNHVSAEPPFLGSCKALW